MIPGVGYFYAGLLRRKNALSLIYLSVAVIGVVSFEVRRIPNPPFGCIINGVCMSVVVLGLLACV